MSYVDNVMYGYSMAIRPLTSGDIVTYGIGEVDDMPNLVAVEPADLGPCLGAVVNLATGEVLWSDTDGDGTPLPDADKAAFGKAVQLVLRSMFDHLRDS